MKKLTVLLAAVLMVFSSTIARADGGFLIKAGITAQSIGELKNSGLSAIKGATRWEAGVGYQTGTFSGFAFQPELLYKAKGVTFDDNTKCTMSYLELPVNIQWGIDLLIARPFVFISPFIGVNLGSNFNKASLDSEFFKDAVKKIEGGFGVGLGVDISKFQVTAKYNWDFGGVANWDEYVTGLKDMKKGDGLFEVAIAFKF